MAKQSEIDRLLQMEWQEKIIPQLGRTSNDPWIPVFQDTDDGTVCLVINCVLIPNENVEHLLQVSEWGQHVHVLEPGFTGGSEDSAPVYHRFVGSEFGIEPLVFRRNFHGLKPDSSEILEEFRLYHNLYFDRISSKLVKFDEGGREVDVVKISDDIVQVSRKELRQFLAARDMSLAVFIERRYYAGQVIEIADSKRQSLAKREHFVFSFHAHDHYNLEDGKPETYSRLLGKTVISGLPREKCGIWPYDKEPIGELEEFIIGVDDNEDPILAFSSPYSRSAATTNLNLPESYVVPDYLTKVFFERKVLDKYDNESSIYSVDDGYLSCSNKWGLQIDNNNPDYVIVWLGDLGRDLPFTEHNHWKQYNVRPDGYMSASHLRSQLPSTVEEALNPGDPENSALRLKLAYENIMDACSSSTRLPFFKPLGDADLHHFKTLRIPSTSEFSEFERLMLSLTVVVCDSIDGRRIKREISGFNPQDAQGNPKKSITILEEFLMQNGFDGTEAFIQCLRTVQDFRSRGAHRKGRNYEKLAIAVQQRTRTTKQIADEIFTTLADFLNSLREHFCPAETD